MTYRELSIPGAWEVTPVQHADARGSFSEFFQGTPFATTVGHRFALAQGNCSVSAAGVIRGIHYADVPPGQAKYVTCASGAVLDVVVDLRVGSPTFGRWDSVLLDDVDRRAVYLSEGLGHGFCALEDGATVLYLCSAPYAPAREHTIDPLDPEMGVAWPTTDRRGRALTTLLSDKDGAAPSLAEAREGGLLPRFTDVAGYVARLAASEPA